jgi:hypothetical protein
MPQSPFTSGLYKKPYSSFKVKNRLFGIALGQAAHDAVHALIPVAIVGGAIAFLVWFWGNGPTDLVKQLFGISISNLLVARVLSLFIVGLPTVIFAKASFTNFLRVQNDPRAMERDIDLAWQRIQRYDEEVKGAFDRAAQRERGI